MRNASGIYLITSPSGGQYVGSAVNMRMRWHGHKTALRKKFHKNRKLQNAWNKYGEDQMSFIILIVCSKKDLLIYEQRAIDILQPRYNLSKVAGNTLGLKWTIEARQRKSEQTKGKKQSLETRQKRSETMRGHPVSDETKKKLAEQRGWKHSEDAKQKMRGKPRSERQLATLRAAAIGNKNRLGSVVSDELKQHISAKLKGMKRSSEAIEKQRAFYAAKRAAQEVVMTGPELKQIGINLYGQQWRSVLAPLVKRHPSTLCKCTKLDIVPDQIALVVNSLYAQIHA